MEIEILKSPKLFITQFKEVEEDREKSIAFVKTWQKDVFINFETGNMRIDKHPNYTLEMAVVLHLLKKKHNITEEEIKE